MTSTVLRFGGKTNKDEISLPNYICGILLVLREKRHTNVPVERVARKNLRKFASSMEFCFEKSITPLGLNGI